MSRIRHGKPEGVLVIRSDVCSCPVTLSCPAALNDWNGVILGLLTHGTQTPVHLGRVMQAAPDFAMGHAARGSDYATIFA